jgi:uncharacterized membrane protein (DUF4010 family)
MADPATSLDLATLQPYVVATAVGLGIGLEREWRSRGGEQESAGARTFGVLGLAGALAASLDPIVVAAGALLVGALLTAGYRRTANADRGTTTEFAAFATYLLGALCWQQQSLAVGLGVVLVVLLAARGPLHRLTHEVVTETEVNDAIRFFVVAFVILPLLPSDDLGPYGVINPQRIWMFVVALTGIGWLGYIATRILGPRRGLLVTGFAGGFVSATATTGAMGRRAKVDPPAARGALGGALLASAATYLQLALVLIVASGELLAHLAPSLAVGVTVVVAEAAALGFWSRDRGHSIVVGDGTGGPPSTGAPPTGENEPEPTEPDATEPDATEPTSTRPQRPFAIVPALTLAAILTVVLLVARWAASVAGSEGAYVAAAAAGLADVHASVLSVASLVSTNVLGIRTAMIACGLGLLANTLVKVLLGFGLGGRRFGASFAALMVLPVTATVAALVLTLP